jgi:hypothetical protein
VAVDAWREVAWWLRWQIRLVRKLMPEGIFGFQAVCPDLGFL